MFGIFRQKDAQKGLKSAKNIVPEPSPAKRESYRVQVALNGVSGDDVDISVLGCVISVKSTTHENGERPKVERYFRMPCEINENSIKTFVDEDVLVIDMRPKLIQIEIPVD